MPAPLISRDQVAQRLFDAFRTYGFEGATLARLSEATGLGRASLYHYFPGGKDDMAREVIALAHKWVNDNVRAPLAQRTLAPSIRVNAAFHNLIRGYDNGFASCVVNLMGVGDAHGVVGKELEELASAYVSAFESFLRSIGIARVKASRIALETVMQVEGALVMARALNDRDVFLERIEAIAQQYLALVRKE